MSDILTVLAIGDVVGNPGLTFLEKTLRGFKKLKNVDFTIVNGENAAGVGLTRQDAQRLYDAGADVITLGNHTFGKRELTEYIDDDMYMLRPANFTDANPGRGYGVYDAGRGRRICVINLIGRAFSDSNYDNPFKKAEDILKVIDTSLIFVDFHAEATSEKAALGRYLDGRVSAVFGTHTHVQTADDTIFPGGTGFITDIGMTGPAESVLGMKIQNSVDRFLGAPSQRFMVAEGDCLMCGALFEVDSRTGKCRAMERVRVE